MTAPVRVMVVDDQADVRYLVRVLLEEGGEAVVAGEADGALAALETIDAVDPDVVVLDARMPVVDGFEAARMIRGRRPGQPILLCTAYVDDEIEAQASAAGIARVVAKDQFEFLADVVAGMAGRR